MDFFFFPSHEDHSIFQANVKGCHSLKQSFSRRLVGKFPKDFCLDPANCVVSKSISYVSPEVMWPWYIFMQFPLFFKCPGKSRENLGCLTRLVLVPAEQCKGHNHDCNSLMQLRHCTVAKSDHYPRTTEEGINNPRYKNMEQHRNLVFLVLLFEKKDMVLWTLNLFFVRVLMIVFFFLFPLYPSKLLHNFYICFFSAAGNILFYM